MKSAMRALLFIVLVASALVGLDAQTPIATITCSGNGQPPLSLPTYGFDSVVEGSSTAGEVEYGAGLIAPDQVPAVVSLIGAQAVYSQCAIGNGAAYLTLTQVTVYAPGYFEFGSGIYGPVPVSYGYLQFLFSPPPSSSIAPKGTRMFRNPQNLAGRMLEALIAKRQPLTVRSVPQP